MTTADGIAIGGGALTASLIDLLVERGVISKSDALTVIERAIARLVILSPEHRVAATDVMSALSHQIAARN